MNPHPGWSESETFLRNWHRLHAGATSSCLADGRAEGGRSSYELLAEVVPATGKGISLLDLGCGDGFLLECVLSRRQGETHAIGVDISTDELALARGRAGLVSVDLRCERAQSLSIADASIDYVLSHMAFMLMDGIEGVVREVARVLRAGGTFSAVVSGALPLDKATPGDAMSIFVQLQRRLLERSGAKLPSMGDPRTRSSHGVRALLGRASGFVEPIMVREVQLRLEHTPARIFDILSSTYPFDLLSDEDRRDLERDFLAQVIPLADARGHVGCTFGLLQFTCVRDERDLESG